MSNQISQKEAVFSAVVSVLQSNNISLSSSTDSALTIMSRSSNLRQAVNVILVNGLTDGSISFGKTGLSQSEIRSYASALQSNWLRKDSRLNGGVSTSIKSASPKKERSVLTAPKVNKAVKNDTQLKALRSLLKIKTDPNEIAEIEGFINKRMSEIAGVSANV